MDLYLLDWVNFLLRWAHVIVAIAWIGSSFYFVFLDSSLTEPTDAELRAKGVGGDVTDDTAAGATAPDDPAFLESCLQALQDAVAAAAIAPPATRPPAFQYAKTREESDFCAKMEAECEPGAPSCRRKHANRRSTRHTTQQRWSEKPTC